MAETSQYACHSQRMHDRCVKVVLVDRIRMKGDQIRRERLLGLRRLKPSASIRIQSAPNTRMVSLESLPLPDAGTTNQ